MIRPRALTAFVLLPFFLTGCVKNIAKDLTFLSVYAVDYHDQVELPSPSSMGLASLLSTSAIARYGLADVNGEKSREPLLKLEFGTRDDLAEILIESGTT